MKNLISFIAIIFVFGLILASCGKKDTIAPKIFLEGDNPLIHTLNAEYVDPGYLAEDNKDGDITSKVSYDATVVKVDKAGTYTIEYTVTDDAGLQGSTTRDVTVKNSIDKYCVKYDVTKYFGGTLEAEYSTTLKSSGTQNMVIRFPNMSNLALNADAEIGGSDVDDDPNTKTYYVTITQADFDKDGTWYRISGRKDAENNPLSKLVVAGSDYTFYLYYRQATATTQALLATASSTNVDEVLVKVNL
ncbi:MAG: DUF5011 domain-containing protein [Bacteroidales bacterium]|nr:DUF5011 domain-containing protein [Bacteroidales bacterium]